MSSLVFQPQPVAWFSLSYSWQALRASGILPTGSCPGPKPAVALNGVPVWLRSLKLGMSGNIWMIPYSFRLVSIRGHRWRFCSRRTFRIALGVCQYPLILDNVLW